MLTFFPWMIVREKTQLGNYELIPYNLKNKSTDNTNIEIKRILGKYFIHKTCPISSATLLKKKDKQLFDDLDASEREEVFMLMEIISFFRLSEREYFCHSDKYTNHDSSQVIIQSFREGESGVVITSRRRDGTMSNYSSDEFFNILKPHHASVPSGIDLKGTFLESLLAVSSTDNWDELQSSVFSFLKANTDNNDISEHTEMMFLAGAFEKILDASSNAASVADKFNELVSQFVIESDNIKCGERVQKRQKFEKITSIREVWARDFYMARGMLAHGAKSAKGTSIWSPFEHLLLASHVFPLLFKLKLALLKFYKLTDDDLSELYYFDHRIRFGDVFKIGEDEYSQPVFGWNEAVKQARWDWLHNKNNLIKKN